MDDYEQYQEALTQIGIATLAALGALEAMGRHLHPPDLPELRALLAPKADELAQKLEAFRIAKPPTQMTEFHQRFASASTEALLAVQVFCKEPKPHEAIARVLAALNRHAKALEELYSLHRFPPLSRFFVEAPYHADLEALDPEPPEGLSVGLHQSKGEKGGATRGGFCLYIPESWDGREALPLVVALHAGSGTGRGFVWTWLREARGRRFILLSPTSRGPTWSLEGPDIDSPMLKQMIEFVAGRWKVDRSRMLLTGLSDGATFTLLSGLREDSPFSHLAPASGVLHSGLLASGAIRRARGKHIYLVHGAQDWMFPVSRAREAAERLREAGANLVYREIEDLSHAYAREENDRILSWFDNSLALPSDRVASAPGQKGKVVPIRPSDVASGTNGSDA